MFAKKVDSELQKATSQRLLQDPGSLSGPLARHDTSRPSGACWSKEGPLKVAKRIADAPPKEKRPKSRNLVLTAEEVEERRQAWTKQQL